MKRAAPAAAKRRRRAAWVLGALLGLIALLALGVALVIVAWRKPAATEPPARSPEVSERAQPAPVAQAPPPAQTAPAAPTRSSADPAKPVKPANPANPAKANDPDHSSDLARLRARGLVLPLPTVSAAQLSDNYTHARAGGAAHEALDLMAPRGTPVVAIDDGRIAKLFLSKTGGITLYQFDPTGEYAYYYAHLDRYADGISEGDNLRKGQLIGYVGSSGNARPDAPHLHLAVFRLGPERQWWRGTPINPFLIWRGATP